MGIFGGNTEKKELMLVFDIGSSSVGGALFSLEASGVPNIIFSLRESIALEQTLETKKFLSATLKSLDVVASKICTLGMGAPKHVFCVLSSPWYVSQIRVINLEKNTPFTFTSKLADGLIQKEITLFKEEHVHEKDARVIELKNIQVLLNGYETAKPLEKNAKDLEMTIFVSMGEEKTLAEIEKTIQKHFSHEKIQFSSLIMSTFATVRDMYSHKENFLLIDLGGEVTDISMVKKNRLRASISFPLGHNFMIRRIATALNSTLGEAKSYLSLFKDNHSSSDTFKKIEPIMLDLKKEWLKTFQESLANLSNDVSIPSAIYLSVDSDLTIFFTELIKKEQFNQYTLAESKFEVISLSTQALHGLVSFKEDVSRDPVLIIESVYVSRFLVENL